MDTITEMETKLEVRRHIEAFCEFATKSARHGEVYEIVGGAKYIKIATGPAGFHGAGRSVHCFVNALTGDVYKAATWHKPALNGSRYNLMTLEGRNELERNFEFSSGFLYASYKKK